MLRMAKILLISSVVLWAVLGALGNVTDWKGTLAPVAAVTSMATFAGGAQRWRATSDPLVVAAGAVFIVTFKTLTAILCSAGAWRMWAQRRSDAETFGSAKTLAPTGCAVAVLGLFGGWIIIGEQWFESWRSDSMREASGGAFRYGGFIALIALMVGARDDAVSTPGKPSER